jgi:hypothetical protein
MDMERFEMPKSRMRLLARAGRLAVVGLSFAVSAVPAQSQGDADLKAISAYTLTLPKYKQYLDATLNLANVAAKNPQLAQRLDGYGNQSLAEQVKTLDGMPPIRAAITSTGFTTRDYVLAQGAILQAGMAYAMAKSGNISDDKVIKEAGVSRANLEFYRNNEAEIDRLAKEAKARMPEEPDSDDGEGDEDDEGDE